MREILFRAKETFNGEWVEGYYEFGYDAETEEPTHYMWVLNHTEKYGDMFMVIPETIGQYTGLTDKNGKKIFEGDVVKCRHNWRWQVFPIYKRGEMDEDEYFFKQKIRGAYGKTIDKENVFIPCESHYYFRNYAIEYFAKNGGFRVRNGGQFHALTRTYIFNRGLEVIGNIHDNPELLKGGN